jgi:TATA-box binding protein (TBP) (component of TFIID and TFIIIB)
MQNQRDAVMLIIPRHQPVIAGLNSYYLNIRKFFEHYQRELGTFGIHMKSPLLEGMIYFDSGQFLSAICLTNGETISGNKAIEKLTSAVEKSNFSISVYQIDPSTIFFWSNTLSAKSLHRDLSTDITDLGRLINKMATQQLTGFIEVLIADGSASAVLFFNSGKIVSASTESGEIREALEMVQNRLIEETNSKGGMFHVTTIPTQNGNEENTQRKTEPTTDQPELIPELSSIDNTKTTNPIPIVEDILSLSESVIMESKQAKNFHTQFRKAAMELADKYSFLDPFLKEFDFIGGKVRLESDVEPEVLIVGVLECIHKMLTPLGLTSRFKERASGWFSQNSKILASLGVK